MPTLVKNDDHWTKADARAADREATAATPARGKRLRPATVAAAVPHSTPECPPPFDGLRWTRSAVEEFQLVSYRFLSPACCETICLRYVRSRGGGAVKNYEVDTGA